MKKGLVGVGLLVVAAGVFIVRDVHRLPMPMY